MSPRTVQISAVVHPSIKSRLELLARATGLKKARIIEAALSHHLQALDELPADVIVPPRIVVDRETGERLLQRIANPSPPTETMNELLTK